MRTEAIRQRKRNKLRATWNALRPHHWTKNLLVFVPVLAAHDASNIRLAAFGFVPFCLAASAVYILNDLTDLEADRAHPRKRARPFAAGDISAGRGLLMAIGLILAAFSFAAIFTSWAFSITLFVYLAATTAYSLILKRHLLVDILALAGLYTLRIVAGGIAGDVSLSPWLLGFSMFVFLALAAVKRQAELIDLAKSGRESAGRAYEVGDLPIVAGLALASATASVLVLALYINLEETQVLYPRPEFLWLICPLFLYWQLRMIMKAHRGEMTDDPIVFAASDLIGIVVILLCAGVAFGAAFEKVLGALV